MMAAALHAAGIEGRYDAIDLDPPLRATDLERLHRESLRGANVTVPHKEVALALAHESSERARAIGAANVLVRMDQGWQADNTDGTGFLDWIEQRAMLFRGALLGTMLRHDTYFFSQLGTFIERADNTARILDVKYYILLPKPSDVGSDVDIQQWATVLRSVSAHRSYRWFYRDSTYRPWLVAEFLILREEMPRSLTFCYQWITRSLDGLGELYGQKYDCHSEAAETYARLEAGKMDVRPNEFRIDTIIDSQCDLVRPLTEDHETMAALGLDMTKGLITGAGGTATIPIELVSTPNSLLATRV